MAARPVRTLITVVMDVLVVAAVALTLRLVVAFFGVLSQETWGATLLDVTRFLVVPTGIAPVETPYGGVFDVSATLTILGLLGVEWLLSVLRRQA